jgi:hypothetical protein
MKLTGTVGTVTLTYRVTSQSLITTDSHTIALTAGDAKKIAIEQQPGNIASGSSFSPAVVTQVQDAYGNSISTTAFRTVLKPVLYDTADASEDNSKSAITSDTGRQEWADPGFRKAGTYQLKFQGTATPIAGGLPITLESATSEVFNITAAAPSKLVFKSWSSLTVTARRDFPTAPVVQLQDAYGNVVKNDTTTSEITLRAKAADGTLISGQVARNFISGNTATASAGEYTFPNLKVGAAAGSYTLEIASVTTSLSVVPTKYASSAFTLNAGATNKLALTTPAATAAAGKSFGTPPVIEIQDADGNRVTPSNAQIQITSADAEVFNTATITTSTGVADFDTSVNKVGLKGTAGSKTIKFTLVSDPTITISQTGLQLTAGDVAKLGVTVQPQDTTAGVAFGTTVKVGHRYPGCSNLHRNEVQPLGFSSNHVRNRSWSIGYLLRAIHNFCCCTAPHFLDHQPRRCD